MKYFPEMNYSNEDTKKVEALTGFVDNQNVWPLLKIIMATTDMRDLEENNEFWLKLLYLPNIKGEDRKELIEICKDRLSYYDVGNLADVPLFLKKNIEKYWNIEITDEIKQLPLFVILKPCLSEDEFSNYLEDKTCNNYLSQEERNNFKKIDLFKNILMKIVNDDSYKTFKILSNNYFTYGVIDYYEEKEYPNNKANSQSDEKISFKNFFENKILVNHQWIDSYSKLIYEPASEVLLKYMKEKIDDLYQYSNSLNNNYSISDNERLESIQKESKKTHKDILKQFKNFLPYLKTEEKESVVAHSLIGTNNLNLMNDMLSIMNTNIKDYKPTNHLLWEDLYNFNNKKIIKVLEKNGAELLDFSPNKKKLLIHTYLSLFDMQDFKDYLNVKNIDEFKEKIFLMLLNENVSCKVKTSEDVKSLLQNSNGFNVLTCSENSSMLDNIINLNVENIDVGLLLGSNRNKVMYKDLEDLEKFIVIEKILEKTWFSPIFYHSELHSRFTKEKKWTLCSYYADKYSDEEGCFLINEHLNLMDKLGKNLEDTKYANQYLDFMFEVLCSFRTNYVKVDSNLEKSLHNIVDKINTHNNFDWNDIEIKIRERVDKNSYIKNTDHIVLVSLYTKLNHSCMNHLMPNISVTDNRKKMKI